ncbi:MAG: peptidase, partial [Paenibacillaceae bacterium]|nr:peptidase [Paenibacillaceae bacterium]
YAAQIRSTLLKKLPEAEELIGKGELLPIKAWLADEIYQYGMLHSPGEIVTRVTGEDLSPDYLVDYLTAKYTEIYKL